MFQCTAKFKERYAPLGFTLWATYFALGRLTAVVEEKIRSLAKRAAS